MSDKEEPKKEGAIYRIRGDKISLPRTPFEGVQIDALIDKYRQKLINHQPKYMPQSNAERERHYFVNSYIVGSHWRRRPGKRK
jgi:hypothetical protein